jgi:hypothetical protein
MLAQCIYFGHRIGEISCPTKYFKEASSISFRRSVKYGFGVLATTLRLVFQRCGLARFRIFSAAGRKLELSCYQDGMHRDQAGASEFSLVTRSQ